MPGVVSLEQHRYYAHTRNAFWPIICSFLEFSDDDYPSVTTAAVEAGLAIWDVVKHCERPGSLDSAIVGKSVQCNDFNTFMQEHQHIRNILFNGKTAEKLFRQQVLPELANADRITLHTLPSTSPAMAALNFNAKQSIWHDTLKLCC